MSGPAADRDGRQRDARQRDARQVVCSDVRAADDSPNVAVDVDRWERLAAECLAAEGVSGELTVSFVDRSEIADLNREHMGVHDATDVLSFPMDDEPQPGVPVLLGDVVISPAVAADQALEHAGTVDDELALLLVHGLLHLLGHDHVDVDDTRTMRTRELELLRAHHWHGPVPEGFRQDHPPS